jgi:microcystin-dependent protein
MSYIVNFTDKNKPEVITVYDNTINTDTSLTFAGRNVTGYGQIIAENFLHLLENFSKDSPPDNPVEGQLWYDTSDGTLKLWDNSNWKAASNIQKSVVAPPTDESNVGELWVDTVNQQLYVFSGSRWILVGPTFSTGLRSGPIVEPIKDSNDQDRVILTFYVEDVPLIIFSKDSFTPKIFIDGFPVIRSGLNITELNVGVGNFDTKLYGRAVSADSLLVAGTDIPGNRFLRSDATNILDFGLSIRNNSGITIGTDGILNLSASATAAKIYNSAAGSSIDFQVNKDGIPSTTVRIINDKVGINRLVPDEALDVLGNVAVSGSIILKDTTPSTNFNNGTIRTAGGVAISKNLLVGEGVDITGITNTQNIVPKENNLHDLGTVSKRWNVIRAKTIVADTVQGVLDGNISGNANTATNLRFPTTFSLDGDVVSSPLAFDGQIGGLSKVFSTTLSTTFIDNKPSPSPNISIPTDTVLVSRPGVGLLKETRNVFVGDLGIPLGGILPYAGAQPPSGFLLCDGGEVEIARYNALFQVIGTAYNGTAPLSGVNTFRLPDLRGRKPLGRDNMDNGTTVPNNQGTPINAGGGDANRVSGIEADTIGGSGGFQTQVLGVANLPNHEHDMRGSTGQQYFATRLDTAVPLDSGASLDRGPTLANQTQYLPSSGGIKTAGSLSQPFSILDPYLTINYIIRSGPPAF